MTNQNGVAGSYDNKIMDSEESDRRVALIKDDVIGRIDCRDGAVGGISLFVLLEIIRYCSPASDIVPVEAGFHYQHPVRFLHNRVIE